MSDKMKLLFSLFLVLFGFNSFSQRKILIEPHLIFQFNKGYKINTNNTEKSFKAPIPDFSLFIGSFIEYFFKKDESLFLGIDGNMGQLSFRAAVEGSDCKVVHIHQTGAEFSQLNVGFNKYFKKEGLKKISFTPKLSAGLGFSKNRPQNYYDEYLTKTINSGCNMNILDFSYVTKRDRNVNLYGWVGYGFNVVVKNKDVLTLVLYYNKGFFNQFKTDLKYKINNDSYSAILGSRATNFNLKIGVPIVLKRWK